MGQTISNKTRSGHAIGTVLGITMVVILLLAGSAEAAPFAYIANSDSNNVSVIDTATNTVTASVNVGSYPYGVAVNPAGTKVYVTNQGSDNVSVIDTATNTVTASVNVGDSPFGIAVNPAGTLIYVANRNSANVSVIDTARNIVITSVNIGSRPDGVAANPAGPRVYVTNGNNVSVIDTVTNTVITRVLLEAPNRGYAMGVAVNPTGTRVYVANGGVGARNVSVINATTNTIITTVNVGDGRGVAVNPAGTLAYVATWGSSSVSVIDTSTNTIITRVPVGRQPMGVAITPDGTKVFVANSVSSSVSVISTATNSVTTVDVGRSPTAFGQFIGAGTVSSSSNVGYSATVVGSQNTFIQMANGNFGNILAGQSKIIPKSVVLNNTGSVNATVDARFADNIGGAYGLINGNNVLGASNFAMKESSAVAWVSLLDSGTDSRIGIAPFGTERNLDARLSVSSTQQTGAYSGTVVLTFGNEV